MSEKQVPNYMKFIIGGAAGMCAIFIVQPLDLIKTRIQMSGTSGGKKEYNNTLHAITSIVSKEGPLTLYSGLSAALLRQATYTTTRLGIYTYLSDKYRALYGHAPTMLASIGQGLAAGVCGAFVGTPADVALIRMSSDGRLPPAERRNYKNVFDAFIRIVREEGVTGLWRGCVPTLGRAIIVNIASLSSYTQFKNYLQTGPAKMRDGFPLHLSASAFSGLLTSVVSMPMDIAKTRIQTQKSKEYRGAIDAMYKISRQEVVLALWKGFTPYYSRMVPLTVLTLVFMEQFTIAYRKFVLGD